MSANRRRPRLFPILLGAALAFFLDPEQGARRRSMIMDRSGSLTGRGTKAAVDTASSTGGNAYGTVQEASSSTSFTAGKAYGTVQEETVPHVPDNPNPDDATLTDRVESEIFRDPNIPKGDININTVDGVVDLRGELGTQQAIDDLIAKVRAVPNVKNVRSYLHVPGTPAPNKESAIEAS